MFVDTKFESVMSFVLSLLRSSSALHSLKHFSSAKMVGVLNYYCIDLLTLL
jgi:hypothetical protein